jgi:hypothetical protein
MRTAYTSYYALKAAPVTGDSQGSRKVKSPTEAFPNLNAILKQGYRPKILRTHGFPTTAALMAWICGPAIVLKVFCVLNAWLPNSILNEELF